MERTESRGTRNSTYDKSNRGASTTIVLNASGTSSRLRRGFSSSSHGYIHGSPEGVSSRVRKWRPNTVGARKWVVRFWLTRGSVRGHQNLSLIVSPTKARNTLANRLEGSPVRKRIMQRIDVDRWHLAMQFLDSRSSLYRWDMRASHATAVLYNIFWSIESRRDDGEASSLTWKGLGEFSLIFLWIFTCNLNFLDRNSKSRTSWNFWWIAVELTSFRAFEGLSCSTPNAVHIL